MCLFSLPGYNEENREIKLCNYGIQIQIGKTKVMFHTYWASQYRDKTEAQPFTALLSAPSELTCPAVDRLSLGTDGKTSHLLQDAPKAPLAQLSL